MTKVEFHPLARNVIRDFSKPVRSELGSALLKLQMGMMLGMPLSRPMPAIAPGAYELRFRDAAGIQRVFYFTKDAHGILVFHAFVKKTQATPPRELNLARRRLTEMQNEKSQ